MSVRQAVTFFFYFEHKTTEHLETIKKFKFVRWALKLVLSLRTAACTLHTRVI